MLSSCTMPSFPVVWFSALHHVSWHGWTMIVCHTWLFWTTIPDFCHQIFHPERHQTNKCNKQSTQKKSKKSRDDSHDDDDDDDEDDIEDAESLAGLLKCGLLIHFICIHAVILCKELEAWRTSCFGPLLFFLSFLCNSYGNYWTLFASLSLTQ